MYTGKTGEGGGGGGGRRGESPFPPLVSPRFFFLREFFSRALLSECLEQVSTLTDHATDQDKFFAPFDNKFNKIVNKYVPITKLSKRNCQTAFQALVYHWIKSINYKLYVSGDEEKYKML